MHLFKQAAFKFSGVYFLREDIIENIFSWCADTLCEHLSSNVISFVHYASLLSLKSLKLTRLMLCNAAIGFYDLETKAFTQTASFMLVRVPACTLYSLTQLKVKLQLNGVDTVYKLSYGYILTLCCFVFNPAEDGAIVSLQENLRLCSENALSGSDQWKLAEGIYW